MSLTALQALLLLWIGKAALNRGMKMPYVLILQLTPFLHETFFRLFERSHPERFMVLVMLLFLLVWIRYAFGEKEPGRKFALASGIVLALGFATKFNYLPVLALPLFVLKTWKNRGIYALSGIGAFFVFVAPILDKFKEFRRFISGIVQHDGLYGSGEEQVFNFQLLLQNLKEIFTSNPEIPVILVLIAGIIIALLLRKQQGQKRSLLLFVGFLVVFVLQVLMVSKHFKNHYLLPLFLLYALMLVESFRTSEGMHVSRTLRYILTLALPLFFLGSASVRYTLTAKTDRERDRFLQQAAMFVQENPDSLSYWYLKPSWQAAPTVENALIYGLSYCARRDRYEADLRKIYPRVITWEGEGKSEKIWRCSEVSLDSLLRSVNPIRVIASPAQQSPLLSERIERVAAEAGIRLQTDTLFQLEETQTLVLRFTPLKNEEMDVEK